MVAGTRTEPVSNLLARPSVPLIAVVPLADEVFADTEEITHGDLAPFKIPDLKETKKHLLSDLLGLLGPGQTPEKDDQPLMMEVVELLNPPGAGLIDIGRRIGVRARSTGLTDEAKPGPPLRIRLRSRCPRGCC